MTFWLETQHFGKITAFEKIMVSMIFYCPELCPHGLQQIPIEMVTADVVSRTADVVMSVNTCTSTTCSCRCYFTETLSLFVKVRLVLHTFSLLLRHPTKLHRFTNSTATVRNVHETL